MKTAAILELPGKGGSAPRKVGSRHGDFIRTEIPGQPGTSHVFAGKLYSTSNQEDIKEFNEVCARVIPNCHRMKMRCVVRIVVLPTDRLKSKAAKKKEAKNKQAEAPKPPALIAPPAGP